jgi:hypothetical protein
MKNGALASVVISMMALSQPSYAQHFSPPEVPNGIEVAAGNSVFLVGQAIGTQNYLCLPAGSAFDWTLVGPQATLFDGAGRQIVTHFLSLNPDEGGTARATWQHSRDTSAVWAQAVASSVDSDFVAPGAIPWLRLQVVGADDGTQGSSALTPATWIQRVNTTGGSKPATGCSTATNVGARSWVPYTADYIFYKKTSRAND